MTRSKPIAWLATAAVIPLTALAVAGCGGGNDSTASSGPPETASGHTATVGVDSNSDLGKILDNPKGDTLYLFKKDRGTTSECTGACASAWPPLRTSGKPAAGQGTRAALIGTTSRNDGNRQITYNGHPLYTFTGDKNPGDTNGQGLNAFGARWYAVSPAGTQITGGGSSSSGGGIY